MSFEDGPLYYREIQKNAYLKRVPNETTGSKLKQLGYKKVPLKPMWTLFCIHNGRTPYLEQYHEAEAPTTLSHKPVWRACLRATRHVTASVRPRPGAEHDFLIDTDHGPVRMIAPDWESMQDWVTTLRNKLHELKILSKGENVYCAAPAAPIPRAAARDPTSPLPPTPPVPPDRVPGIELIPPRPPPEEEPQPTAPEPDVDISNWEENPQPSTSTEAVQPKSVTKICGQNICLDDSILRRKEVTDSDEEFFAEVDRIHDSSEEVFVDSGCEFRQTVVVGEDEDISVGAETLSREPQATNITVIQVSNKGPPHTAIPVLGPETDIFSFNFEQKLKIEPTNSSFVNIVNTEVEVQNSNDNGYGTVFSNDGDYGHLSLTTTVNLTDNTVERTPTETDEVKPIENDQESVYERLCMASTSNDTRLNRLKNIDKIRKSSLPNLEIASTSESTYEYLFPNNNKNTMNINLRSNENHVNLVNGSVGNGMESNARENNGNRPTEIENRHTNLSNSISVGVDPNTRVLRSNIERSHSQNAYDSTGRVRENLIRRVQNNSPKRDGKNDKTEPAPAKPIWKRGLTELSLLTRLRGIGVKRQESPTRQETQNDSQRAVTSPVKVPRRSRPEVRIDTARRRSSSLSNGQSPPPPPALQPLRARQAAALRAEQRRGAAVSATVANRDPPIFADYDSQVWVCWWGAWGVRCGGRAGDRVAGLRAAAPRDAHHARQLIKQHGHLVDILFHRVPLGKIYVLNRRENESIGIKLDGECNIITVDRNSPAGRAGLPPAGKWAVTEVNNRPLNLIKGGDEEMNRLSMHGSEISVLIQPSALVKKLRAAIKANKHLLSIR